MNTSRLDLKDGHCYNNQLQTPRRDYFDPFRGFGFINDGLYEFVKNVKDVFTTVYGNFETKMDISEDDNKFQVILEIPGVAKDNIKIIVNGDDTLEISGKKNPTFVENTECSKEECAKINLLKSERKFGDFVRTIVFGCKINKNNINAKFNNGELLITVEKAEEEKPKQIEIAIN